MNKQFAPYYVKICIHSVSVHKDEKEEFEELNSAKILFYEKILRMLHFSVSIIDFRYNFQILLSLKQIVPPPRFVCEC